MSFSMSILSCQQNRILRRYLTKTLLPGSRSTSILPDFASIRTRTALELFRFRPPKAHVSCNLGSRHEKSSLLSCRIRLVWPVELSSKHLVSFLSRIAFPLFEFLSFLFSVSSQQDNTNHGPNDPCRRSCLYPHHCGRHPFDP